MDIEFEGYTWPERFAVLTTRFDFAAAIGCSQRSYFADPDQWVNLFKVAGDAAHVNNPIGGLGLNCGVHDAMELVDTLAQAEGGHGADALLDRYERRRRTVNIEFVQQQTVDNKRRLEAQDPTTRRERLDALRSIAEDGTRQRAFLRRTSLLDGIQRAHAID